MRPGSGPAKSPPTDVGPLVRRMIVERHRAGIARRSVRDTIAVEEPLELRVETRPVGVIMRTPGHDEELAAGFLLSEGVIRQASDLRLIRRHPRSRTGNLLEVYLSESASPDWSTLTRHGITSSSCGLCGATWARESRRRLPRLEGGLVISDAVLSALPTALGRLQSGFSATGGLHASALCGADGAVRIAREDIGRHNAVDKVLGRALLDGLVPLRDSVLLVSGRVSFEIVQKALAAGIPVVAAVGAPSTLAVSLARTSGQTLVGFLRDDRFNVYTGAGRVGAATKGKSGPRKKQGDSSPRRRSV